MVIRVRISKTNQEGEVNDVRFVKDGVARALRTLRAATSPEPAGRVRVIREWAYDASSLSLGRAFLCGDSACFNRPAVLPGRASGDLLGDAGGRGHRSPVPPSAGRG